MNSIRTNSFHGLLILSTLLFWSNFSFCQTITFDDSDPELMVIDNGSAYEIAMFKNTGAFSYIKDKSTGLNLTVGYDLDGLWNVLLANDTRIYSSVYRPEAPNRFEYSWDEIDHILTLSYIPDTTVENRVTATVTLSLSADEYFDIQLNIEYGGSDVIEKVEFPSVINMNLGEGDRVFFPVVYPGLMYGSEFFTSGGSTGYECDYISFLINEGNMSVYQLHDDTCIQTVEEHLHSDRQATHNYNSTWRSLTWIEGGESWTSQVARIRIGQTSQETIQAFREDNGFDSFLSLKSKLSGQFDVIARSPVFGYAFPPYEPPGYLFTDVPSQLESYPAPAILFIAMYYLSGFPGWSPDYYPPVPFLGTTEDFQNMVDTLQSRGHLIMLFTIPGMWHADSPTLLNLPDTISIEDIAVAGRNGEPIPVDHFGDPYYWPSPSSPFVQQKFDEIYNAIFNIYGADIIYEDAATTVVPRDFNRNASSPTSIHQKWLDYYKERSNYPTIVEGAFIRMAESVTGIFGTSYGSFEQSEYGWDYETDDGYWRPYPVVSWLQNDKVIPYHSFGRKTTNKDIIAWSMLFGCPFQVDLDEMSDRPYWIIEEQDGWIPVIHDFQGRVTSRIIGKQMIDYTDMEGPATRADYGDIFIIRNWDHDSPYNHDVHSIAPHGIYAQSTSGDMFAGILYKYNGADLSSGDHYLIVETFSDSIEVRHPMGGSTPVQVTRPVAWTDTDQIHIYAITQDSITDIAPTFESDYIQFQLKETAADTTRILKYLILYGDTLQITSNSLPVSETNSFECYPNPFASKTRIRYEVTNPGRVVLKVYDLSGQEIRTLEDAYFVAGRYSTEWNGTDNRGFRVSPGLYIVNYSHIDQRSVMKLVMLGK